MAILSGDKQRPVKLAHGFLSLATVPLAGYTNFGSGSTEHTVFKGSIVICDVSDTDGYFRACPAASTTNAATGDIFGGIAVEKQKVLSGDTADGAVELSVARDGVWGFPVGSIAITDVGAIAYADDDDTVTTTRTAKYLLGMIEGVDATYVWVNIQPFFMQTQTIVP